MVCHLSSRPIRVAPKLLPKIPARGMLTGRKIIVEDSRIHSFFKSHASFIAFTTGMGAGIGFAYGAYTAEVIDQPPLDAAIYVIKKGSIGAAKVGVLSAVAAVVSPVIIPSVICLGLYNLKV